MKGRGVRERCEATLRTLILPRPFTLKAFCSELVHTRRRPLQLLPLPDDATGPCGLWIATSRADFVFYQVATSPLHQEHIVLHELAHMVLGHTARGEAMSNLHDRLLPDLSPTMVASVLGRSTYTTDQELEAETLAGLIGGRAHRNSRPISADQTFVRVYDVLGPLK